MDGGQLSEKNIRYENMFLSILQNEGKIEPFLDAVFKFLYRRYLIIKLFQTKFRNSLFCELKN
jgi:hypothetical protein